MFPVLFGGPIFDDHTLIFGDAGLIQSPSGFTFLDYKSFYFKAWPLSYVILWHLYQIVGTNFFIYKLINLTLHILNCLLAFKILSRLKFKFAFAVTLIFAIHPLQVETVAWIFQLKTLFSIFWGLLAINYFLYLREKKLKWFLYTIPLIFFFLSLLSKISLIFLPVFFLIIGKKNKTHLVVCLSFIIISALVGYSTLRGVYQNNIESKESSIYYASKVSEPDKIPTDNEILFDDQTVFSNYQEEDNFSLTSYLSRPILNLFFYLQNYLIPFNLSLVYPPDIASTLSRRFISIALMLGILILLIIKRREIALVNSFINYSVLHILLCLPILGFVYIPYMKFTPVADHWIYPGILSLALLSITFSQLLKRDFPISKYFRLGYLLLFLYWSGYTFYHSYTFSSETSILEKSAKNSPDDFGPALSLVNSLIRDKKYEQAEIILKQKLKTNHEKPMFFYDKLVQIHRLRSDYSLLPYSLNLLAREHFYYSKQSDAKEYYKESLRLNPNQQEAKFFLELMGNKIIYPPNK